jgi:hypothetical protein
VTAQILFLVLGFVVVAIVVCLMEARLSLSTLGKTEAVYCACGCGRVMPATMEWEGMHGPGTIPVPRDNPRPVGGIECIITAAAVIETLPDSIRWDFQERPAPTVQEQWDTGVRPHMMEGTGLLPKVYASGGYVIPRVPDPDPPPPIRQSIIRPTPRLSGPTIWQGQSTEDFDEALESYRVIRAIPSPLPPRRPR